MYVHGGVYVSSNRVAITEGTGEDAVSAEDDAVQPQSGEQKGSKARAETKNNLIGLKV